MKKLITIQKSTIGNNEINSVSARELYLGLGLSKDQWARWSTANIEQNEFFLQGVDFIQLDIKSIASNPNPPKDYAISIDFAKHISMMAKTSKGHEYRNYFLELENKPVRLIQQPSFAEAIAGVEVLANYLRLSESSRIAFVKPVIDQYGVAIVLPSYAVDKPESQTIGSSMPTKAVTALLKEYGSEYGFSAVAFNKHLESLGFVETLTRKSSQGKDKQYKSVTNAGLEYGKNITSPSNPKETQPHWYIYKFPNLLDLVLSHIQS